MIDNENKKSAFWAPALEIFSQISVWIAGPIILALIAGKILDKHFNTKPIIFLSLALLGFIISCIGIVKVIKNYTKKLKNIDRTDNKNKILQDKEIK